MLELLAPAGDIDSLRLAIEYGADAVFLGGTTFGMRSASKNFTPETLKEGVDFAHSRGVKVHLTCNTLPYPDEIDEFPKFIKMAAECGVDAAICGDIGIMSLVQEHAPNLDIHISTQAGVVNHVTANQFYKMGAKRVILAREMNIEDIKKIRANIPDDMEIEVFVHGAMCVSFSGRCLISNYMVGRDANRGECAQPCRWKYHLVENRRPNAPMEILEEEEGSYILNAKDLSMVEHMEELIQAGVTSFKIEGRAKSSYYVSTITNAYRIALDCAIAKQPLPQWVKEEVFKVSHRQYCTGFYFGHPNNCQYYDNSGYTRNYDFIGKVNKCENGEIHLTQRNHFVVGDVLEVLSPKTQPKTLVVEELYNSKGEQIQIARHPLEQLVIKSDLVFPENSILRRKSKEI